MPTMVRVVPEVEEAVAMMSKLAVNGVRHCRQHRFPETTDLPQWTGEKRVAWDRLLVGG